MRSTIREIVQDQIGQWYADLKTSDKPMIIGINGPQGCGKSTLVRHLQSMAMKVVSMSLDDFYWTFEHQHNLSLENPNNPLLQYRGNPGTHDLNLLQNTLADLIRGNHARIPVYDKSLHNGRGDRLPQDAWVAVDEPVDIVLIEGWCLGFRHADDAALARLSAQTHAHLDYLKSLNQYLEGYEHLYACFDAFVHIRAHDLDFVYDWRWQQEETMRMSKGRQDIGLNREQVKDFVDRFMPLYHLGLPALTDLGLFGGQSDHSGRHLQLTMDKSRNVTNLLLL